MTTAGAAAHPVAGGITETRARVERLIPLVGAYLLLATFYAWQAWRRETPTIFTDELETTQISRAIADTGHAMRRGEPYGFTSLVPYLTAPFWWIHPVASAYETIKTVQAFVMAAAIFPAYLLARRVVTPGWALFAAVGTIAAPALSYSPILVEEPWAYPAATLALWLTVRATDRPTRAAFALAFAACIVAVLVRAQLVALFGALAAGLLVLGWRSVWMRRYRAAWSTWDRVGFWTLAAGALIAVVAFAGHRSGEWETATTLWKGRMVEYGSWAGGAFAIGIGIVPAIALLAVLAVPARERERPGVRAFVAVTAGAVVSFAWYAAIKGTYLSTTFSSLVVERNLVYLAPLAFVATAYLLERAAAPAWAIVASGAVVLGLVVWTPIERGLDNFPYYEAHGFAILALANREWHWPESRIAAALVVLGIASVIVLLLTATPLRPSRLAVAVPVAIAVAILGWNAVAETYASIGEHDFSSRVVTNLPKPKDWVDRATGGGSTVVLGQRMDDNPLGFASTRVLEPLHRQGLERRRDRAGAGAHAHARSPRRRRDSLAESGDHVRRRRERRPGCRAHGRDESRGERQRRPARREADPAPVERHGGRGRRLDGRRRGRPDCPRAHRAQPVRRLSRGHGQCRRHAVPSGLLPEGRAAPGCRAGARGGARPWAGQTAGDRTRDGLRDGLRAGLRRADGRAAHTRRAVARGGRDRDVRPAAR